MDKGNIPAEELQSDGAVRYLFGEVKDLYEAYNKTVANRKKRKVVEQPFIPQDIDPKLAKIYSSEETCEKTYLGFLWNHPLRKSPDYVPNRTFDAFKESGQKIRKLVCLINKVTKMTSKKDTTYWLLSVEDANSEAGFVQVWADMYERFKDELKEGAMVCLKLQEPGKGFKRYTLDSPPPWQRKKLPSKDVDDTVFVMA